VEIGAITGAGADVGGGIYEKLPPNCESSPNESPKLKEFV